MIEQIIFLEKILGPHQAVATYLGYSLRQYYNIRGLIFAGIPISRRIATLISNKISYLKI